MSEFERYDAIVIGAGVAGLTAAADLGKRNVRALVLERHNVPGGCASFFQRDGYRFDVGATLASGFGSRGVHRILNARLGVVVSPEVTEPAMVVHLPGVSVTRHGDQRWRAERLRVFGPSAEPFWHAQERIAELAWDFSKDAPPLPVDAASIAAFLRALRPGHLPLALTLGRNVASIMPRPVPPPLRAFVDAQLLITAQTDAAHADLAYGCTALDLAREGTYHLADGISTIAESLARAVRRLGGRIRYNAVVGAIETERGRVHAVRLTDGTRIDCDRVIAAIPLQNTAALCPPLALKLRPRLAALPERWGAFTLYCGLPPGIVPPEMPLHHQFVTEYDAPPGEGNTVFLSLSGPADRRRARNGGRAVTLSTHTDVARWERAHRDDRTASLRADYTRRLTAALDRILPAASARATLLEPADPHTFARYTARHRGLVGGTPQTPATAFLHAQSHRTPIRGLYLAGDTTFPGQSTVGATLGALNASRAAAHHP